MNDAVVIQQLRELLLQVRHKTTLVAQIQPELRDWMLRLNANQLYEMAMSYIKARTGDPDPLAYHGSVKLDLDGQIIDTTEFDVDPVEQNKIVDETILGGK